MNGEEKRDQDEYHSSSSAASLPVVAEVAGIRTYIGKGCDPSVVSDCEPVRDDVDDDE